VSARLGRLSVELSGGETQQPSSNVLMRNSARISLRDSDRSRQSTSLGFGLVVQI
jgi:hypothetical protein